MYKKKYLIIAIIFAFIKCNVLLAQPKSTSKKKENNDGICLKIIGLAVENQLPLDGVTVKLFRGGEEISWEEITSVPHHEHSFAFDLECDSEYSIEVSKQGYLSRLISVSTAIPKEGKGKEYLFEFQVELVKKKQQPETYYSDFPIAIISYNKSTKVFQDHARYTKRIKDKMEDESFKTKSTKKKK